MGGGRAGGGLVRRALQVRRARVRAPLVVCVCVAALGAGGPVVRGLQGGHAHATPMDRCGMAMGAGRVDGGGGVNRVLHTLHTLHTFFREKGREDLNLFFSSSALKNKKINLRPPETLDHKTVRKPCKLCKTLVASVGCNPEHTQPHPHSQDAGACGWGMKDTRCTSFRQTSRAPSTCGCSPRVRSGLPPREDRASNLVGPVRGVIGLVGWRGLFQAVRHIGRKWATCTPSAPPRPPCGPHRPPWGTLGAHVVEKQSAHARRARRRGCKCGESPAELFNIPGARTVHTVGSVPSTQSYSKVTNTREPGCRCRLARAS